MVERCVTKLLSDEPTSQDVFGPHTRIAAAIADLITTENSGKSIAVTGAWGSGKSSVLRMLQKELGEVADVFIFDAWAHEGDPLRRSFLERLIDFLSSEYLNLRLDSLRDKIFLRAKMQEVTTQPILTWAAKFLGFALLLVPVGVAVCSAAVRMPNPTGIWFGIGLSMIMFPILVLLTLFFGVTLRTGVSKITTVKAKLLASGLAIAITSVCVWRFRSIVLFAKAIPFHSFIGYAVITILAASIALAIFRHTSDFSEVLPLLLNKTITTTRTESIEPVDPSSIEFQRCFAEILKVYGKTVNKKLVIAIDNLDRVDSDLALRLWSTMRTFFEFDFEVGPAPESLWLVATFDTRALRRLWPVEETNEGGSEQFVTKTFQTSFSVPPLVLINRGDYLRSQLARAFPSHTPGEFSVIVQLYDLKYMGELSTPRDITKFVNAVGSLHRQWSDQISLIQQALYIIVANGRTDIFNILSAVNSPVAFPREIIGDDFEETLTAIHFNVPKPTAAHVLLSSPLSVGLSTGNRERIIELSKISGFDRILEDVVIRNRQNWIQHGTESLANAILILDLLYDRNQSAKNAWRWLTKAATQIDKWNPVDKKTGEVIVLLVKRAESRDTIDALLKSAGASLQRSPNNLIDHSPQALQKYVADMRPLFEVLPTLPNGLDLTVIGTGETFVSLLKEIKFKFSSKWEQIANRVDTAARTELIGVLTERAKRVLADDYPEVIRILRAPKFDLNWEPFLQAVSSVFANTANNFMQDGYQRALESILILLNSHRFAVGYLESMMSSGVLYHLLALSPFGETKYAAEALLVVILFGNSEPRHFPGRANEGWRRFLEWKKSVGESFVATRVAEVAIEFEQIEGLRKKAEHEKDLFPMISSILAIALRLQESS